LQFASYAVGVGFAGGACRLGDDALAIAGAVAGRAADTASI
jgi:hypothetical protein